METSTFSYFFLLLTLMGAGNGGIDIVSVIPAKEYFKSRAIDPAIENLVKIASEKPTSAKKQIAQLLAIRQLAVEVESVKKSPGVAEIRYLLQQIAQGKKANDPTGFAAEYAGRTLVVLDGGKEKTPDVSGWKEGMAWIPKSVTFLAGIDSRGSESGGLKLPDLKPFFGILAKEEKEQLFDTIEKLGNVRIDRIVVGFRELEKDDLEIFVRATGKANSDWFVQSYKGRQVEERAGGPGPKIRVLRPDHPAGKGPAMALVGDTDFLLAGVETMAVRNLGGVRFVQAADVTTLDKMLALVAKAGPDAPQGVLKADLAKVPAAATGVALGELPSWMQKGAPFQLPKIIAHAQRTADGIDLRILATTDSEDNAKKLMQTIGQVRDAALGQMAKLKAQPQKIPGADLNSIIALLESIQPRSEGSTIQIRVLASSDAMMSISRLLFQR